MADTQTVTSEVTWTLGELIRKARKDAELDQQQLAEKIGVSRALVGHWENDRGREPSYRQLVAIADATSFPLEILLVSIGYKSNIAGERPFDLLHGTTDAIQTTLNLYPAVRSVHSG